MDGPVGAVLAGGRGRRIGGDKATVSLLGVPLVRYPLAALREVLGDDVAVVAKRGTALPNLVREASIWIEPDEPRHPVTGIRCALACARGRDVLVVACDLPVLDAGTLRALLAAAAGRPRALAVVPEVAGRLEPLCALYRPGVRLGDGPLAESVRAAGAAVVPFDDPAPFRNVNAPEDLFAAEAALRARRA